MWEMSADATFTKNDSIIYKRTNSLSKDSYYSCGCQPGDTIRMYTRGFEYFRMVKNDVTYLRLFGSETSLREIRFDTTSLVSLDLSHFRRLRRVDIYRPKKPMESLILDSANIQNLFIINAGLRRIDFSGQINMEVLNLAGGYQKSDTMDLSGCSNLKDLYLAESNIGHLELPTSGAIQNIMIRNTLLDTLILRAVDSCKVNLEGNLDLKYVDATQAVDLFTLTAFEVDTVVLGNHPRLIMFDCSGSKMRTVDLRACPKLRSIYGYDSALESLQLGNHPDLYRILVQSSHFKIRTLPPARSGLKVEIGYQYNLRDTFYNGMVDLSQEKYFLTQSGALSPTEYKVYYHYPNPYYENDFMKKSLTEGKDYREDEGKIYFLRTFTGDTTVSIEYRNAGVRSDYNCEFNNNFFIPEFQVPALYVESHIDEVVHDKVPVPFYPNPTKEQLYWLSSVVGNAFKITTLNGLVVKSGVIEVETSVGDLPPGIYMVGVNQQDEWVWHKMVKE